MVARIGQPRVVVGHVNGMVRMKWVLHLIITDDLFAAISVHKKQVIYGIALRRFSAILIVIIFSLHRLNALPICL